MKALIIGAAGFVGNYLIRHLQETYDWQLFATKLPGEQIDADGIGIYDLDILNKSEIAALLAQLRPDYIFHLAAQSSVALSWKDPDLTVEINIKGSIHLMDAVRDVLPAARVLLIGSGEEYGVIDSGSVPITEDTLVRPGNIYAATKACQTMIGALYARAYHLHIIPVRAFNHVGPNQAPFFVVSDFCKQVAEIEAGLHPPVMWVGNLTARRDFTDVRDVVRAYGLLVQKGTDGQIYNIGSGHAVEIRQILDMILSLSPVDIEVRTDPAKLRPIDVPIIEADLTKITSCINWQPKIPLQQTLQETLDYWRGRSSRTADRLH